MASSRSAKICPYEGKDKNENEKENSQEVVSTSNNRKFSFWFQKQSSGNFTGIRNIPGQTWSLVELLLLRTLGFECFTRRIEKYESSVFRFNLGIQAVFLCDWHSAQNCFDSTKILKERRFGRKILNGAILDGHTPTMFSNGIDHAKKKSFHLKLTRWVEEKFLIQTLLNIIPQHLKSWNTYTENSNDVDIEENIHQLSAAIVSDLFFGTALDFESMKNWQEAIFKKPNPKKAYHRQALEAYDELYNSIIHSKRINHVLKMGRAEGLTDDEVVKEIFFAAVFNAFPAIAYSTVSLFGRISLLSLDQINEIKDETKSTLRDGLCKTSLQKLNRVEQFVLEVFRLSPPAPLLFGRARYDFMIDSDSSFYQIKKDETLVASIYQVQRDPTIYSNPCDFNPERFKDKEIKGKLIAFGGNFNEPAKVHTHKCPGQEIATKILKVIFLFLINCHIELTEEPQWSGKKLNRFGRPDYQMNLVRFQYKEPPFAKKQPIEVIELENEDETDVKSDNDGIMKHYKQSVAVLKFKKSKEKKV